MVISMNSFDEKIALLGKRIEDLEQRKKACLCNLERVSAVNDTARLMGKFLSWQCRHDNEGVPSMRDSWKLFANRDDCTLEIEDYGVYIGINNIREWFEKFGSVKPFKGVMFDHHLATPQIVVAGDCQTARAVWQSPGHETDPRYGIDGGSEESKPVATWCWGRIQAAFIKMDGEWKMWHYHFYLLFRIPFYTAWTDYYPSDIQKGGPRNNPAYDKYNLPEPDGKPTYHHPFTSETIQIPVPDCPAPYETWSDELPWPTRSQVFMAEEPRVVHEHIYSRRGVAPSRTDKSGGRQ